MERKEIQLRSGDANQDHPECVCVFLETPDSRVELEVPTVRVSRKYMATRPKPRAWDNDEAWEKTYRQASWVWSARQERRDHPARRERLAVRRYFTLPDGAKNVTTCLEACCIGNMELRLDGEKQCAISAPDHLADNFIARFPRKDDTPIRLRTVGGTHVLEVLVDRHCITPDTRPGGVIYVLKVSWEQETAMDEARQRIGLFWRVLRSRLSRGVAMVILAASLVGVFSPWLSTFWRGACVALAIAALGWLLSPYVSAEIAKRK